MLGDLAKLAGGQMAARLLGFVGFAWLARRLPTADYGAVEVAASFSLMFAIVVDGGLGAIGVRRMHRRPDRTATIAREVLGARTLLALVAAATMVALGAAAADSGPERSLVALYAASLLFLPWNQVWLFQGAERLGIPALLQVVRVALFTGIVLVAVDGARRLWAVGGAEIAGVVGSGLAALWIQRRRIAPIGIELSPRRLAPLLHETLPLGASQVLFAVGQYAPPLVVAELLGLAAAGTFGGAYRLCLGVATISWIYQFNLYPAISRLATASDGALEMLVRASFRLAAWASLGVAAVLSIGAAPLLALLFGARFAAAGAVLAVLAWTLPVGLLAGHARWCLVATGGERAVTVAVGVGTALTLGLGTGLVLALGAVGAAIASLVAGLASWALLHAAARRRLGWMPVAPALPPAALAISELFVARRVPLPPALAALLAGVLFAVAAPLVDRRLGGALRQFAGARTGAPFHRSRRVG